jgi:hypothetical protein
MKATVLVGDVLDRLRHRNFVGIELNPEYAKLAQKRIGKEAPMFNEIEVSFPAAPALPDQLRSSLPLEPEPAS